MLHSVGNIHFSSHHYRNGFLSTSVPRKTTSLLIITEPPLTRRRSRLIPHLQTPHLRPVLPTSGCMAVANPPGGAVHDPPTHSPYSLNFPLLVSSFLCCHSFVLTWIKIYLSLYATFCLGSSFVSTVTYTQHLLCYPPIIRCHKSSPPQDFSLQQMITSIVSNIFI
jgi:hypothetical protein